MLKTSLLAAGVMALACACASNPPATRTATANAAANPGSPVGCVNKTATRLPTTPADCAGFGNSHSANAIRSTGETQAGEALRLLDPSITTHP